MEPLSQPPPPPPPPVTDRQFANQAGLQNTTPGETTSGGIVQGLTTNPYLCYLDIARGGVSSGDRGTAAAVVFPFSFSPAVMWHRRRGKRLPLRQPTRQAFTTSNLTSTNTRDYHSVPASHQREVIPCLRVVLKRV